MTRIEFWSAVMGLLVAMVVMFTQGNGRIDRLQAESNARFDAHEAKTDARFDAVNTRFDAAQVENSRQHDDLNRRFDELFEVLRAFEGRISRLEGRLEGPGEEDGPRGP